MSTQNIQVAVRCRPLNDREKKQNSFSVIECNERRKEIVAFDRNSAVSNTKTFTFDRVFGLESKQNDVYNQVVKPVVMEVIEGYNCTIFAYGQTGTGKTFTMEGDRSSNNDDMSWEDDPLVGIIPRSVAHLFTSLKSMPNCEYSVKISYIELYNEELSDLLSEQSIEKDEKLKIYDDPARKGSVLISKLEEVTVQNKNQVYKILQKGAERRQKAATLMNSQSSRSHSIFTITVFVKEKTSEGEETIKVGKLNLVDLAGSENIERSGATGKRAAEAGKINKSLTTLGRVITALVEHRDHIPYRESNLTRLLQDSLGGRTKTTIIATISPALCNLEETLSTLDYAHKAKSIRNKPEINQKLVKKALIKEYTEEIERLRRELNSAREKNGVYLPEDMYKEIQSSNHMQKEEIRELLQKISTLSDELEKLNDLFKETKLTLDEKTESLYQTEHKLFQTQNNFVAIKLEYDETKYVLEEKIKSEAQLYNHAKSLAQITTEVETDCKGLHDKIDRVNSVNMTNRNLINNFARLLIEKINEANTNENELSGSCKQKLCCLCEILNEIKQKVKQSKEEQISKIDLFDDKQKNWLGSIQTLIENEIETNYQEYFQEFMKSSSAQNMNLTNSYNSALKICNEHKESFTKMWSHFNQTVESMDKSLANFESNLTDFTNEFLVSYLQDSAEQTNKTVHKIEQLSESLENTKSNIKELHDFKHLLQSTVSESLKSFQLQLVNFENKINDALEVFEKKCSNIETQNLQNSTCITKLKDYIKENEQNMAKKFTSHFQTKINAPFKNLIEANSKNKIELNVLSKSLNEKNEVMNSHYINSIQGFRMMEHESSSSQNKIVTNQLENLKNYSKKIEFTLREYKEETNKYFEKLKSHCIESPSNDLIKLVNESISLTNEAKHVNDSLSELNREFHKSSIRSVNELAEKDFAEYMPTGMTPERQKDYSKNIELPKSKSMEELVECYRNSKQISSNDFKNPNVSPFFNQSESMNPTGNLNSQSTSDFQSLRISTDMSTSQATSGKRTMDNKENTINMGEKSNKMQKYASQTRLGIVKKPSHVFQDKN